MTDKKVPIYVWFRFLNCYSWNLDKEFIAYMLGYESKKGDYTDYVTDYGRTSDKYKTLNNYLVWSEHYGKQSMYDLAPFHAGDKIQDSIYLQLKELPELTIRKWMEERAKFFPSYLKKREKTGIFKNLDVDKIEYRDAKNNVIEDTSNVKQSFVNHIKEKHAKLQEESQNQSMA